MVFNKPVILDGPVHLQRKQNNCLFNGNNIATIIVIVTELFFIVQVKQINSVAKKSRLQKKIIKIFLCRLKKKKKLSFSDDACFSGQDLLILFL